MKPGELSALAAPSSLQPRWAPFCRENRRDENGEFSAILRLPLKMKSSGITDLAQANGDSHWAQLMALDPAVHGQLVPGDFISAAASAREAAASLTIAQLRLKKIRLRPNYCLIEAESQKTDSNVDLEINCTGW
jgi:hypothetical protein